MTESPDPLAFTPVPSASTRHDGWTPERQRRFIEALAATGGVAAAARAVGESSTTAYRLRERPGAESFARAWATAQSMADDRHFAQAMDRAVNGYLAPRYYRGERVGTVRRYDYRPVEAALRRITAPPTAAEEAAVAAFWAQGDEPAPLPGPSTPSATRTEADPGPFDTLKQRG